MIYKKRDLQLALLDMAKDIDEVCKKHNIKYYLAYGTCLGAIRHKGFIPWDDDFDIMLKYEDYVKFLDVCKKELDAKKYFVQTSQTDENYYLAFSKIRNIQTTLIEEGNRDRNMINGIYVDVFPLVGCPKNKLKRLRLKINRAFLLSTEMDVINNKLLLFAFKLILKIFGKKRIKKHCTKQCLKYKCSDYEDVVSIFDGDGFGVGLTSNKALGDGVLVDFENLKLPVPVDYDSFLTTAYGDYMKIPSKAYIDYRTHTAYYINLKKHYTIDEIEKMKVKNGNKKRS